MKQIATALVNAQKAFGPALKSSTNPHFKSKYADLSACVEAVIDGLNGAGIAMIQRTSEDFTGVTVETVFIHESGEMLECGKLHVPANKQDPQGYGSALTYARRYSLMAACGIAPEDDDGNGGSRRTETKTPDITDHLLAIEGSGSSEQLAKIYKDALAACEGNQVLQTKVIQAKKARIERVKKGQS
jgi:hypothetical protein